MKNIRFNSFLSTCQIPFILLFLLLVGCGKDEITTESGGTTFPEPGHTIESRLEGIIKDESDQLMANVQIEVEGVTTTTNDKGFFRLTKLSLNNTGSLVKAIMPGYIEGYKTVYPHSQASSYVEMTLVKIDNPSKFDASIGGDVIIDGNGTINFKANSIVYQSGGDYNGEVKVYSHWYNPKDSNTPLTMPGNLNAIDDNNNEYQLQSFGMIYVVLKSNDDKLLQIKEGNEASIIFPSLDGDDDAPEELPLWYFDESIGKWVEDGSAILNGDHYEGSVSHFSFWNCDVSFPLVEIEGRLLDISGNPISNYPITVLRGGWYGATDFTNANGEFKGKVPANEVLRLIINHCGIELVNQEFGPFSSDQNLGDYNVSLTDFAFPLTGKLLSCGGLPNNTAYGVTGYKLITANADGSFSTIISGCGASTSTVVFSDPVSPAFKTFSIPTNQPSVDLGDITLCDLTGAYLVYTIDGQNPSLATAPEAVLIDEKIDIRNQQANIDGVRFNTTISTQSVGTSNPLTANAYSIVFTDNLYLVCEDEDNLQCDDFDFTITYNGGLNDTLKGYFTGSLYAIKDSLDPTGTLEAHLVEGSFNIPIVNQFNSVTIKGKAWVDEDFDGIQDNNENYVLPTSFSAIKSDGSYPVFGTNWVQTDIDGNYTISGLEPGEYHINSYLPFGSELSPANVGSDDALDCDFTKISNNVIKTPNLTLNDGETIENIDIGFSIPDLTNSFISYNGCVPEIYIFGSVQGGLPPFTYELSDGQSNNTGQFEVSTGGSYTITVTDVLNRSLSTNTTVYDYNNSVSGRIWEEDPLTTPGVFNQNQDIYLKDITVELYDENDNLIQSVLSGQYDYQIRNINPGKYYIKVVIPTGYELVIPNAGGSPLVSSQIDPSSMQSPIFEILDCNQNEWINAGMNKL